MTWKQKKLRRTLVSSCIAVTLLSASVDSSAIFGVLYAEAKINVKTEHQIVAGLDDKTRAMILSMAPQVRAEAIAFLREAVPLVGEEMSQFLNRLDLVLENRINGLVCAGQGLAKGVAEELGAAWRNERPKPLIELSLEFDKRKGFDAKSAKYITLGYYDFLHNAAITSCQLADSDAKKKVEKMRAEARQRLRIWEEIEGTCVAPSDCLAKRYSQVSETVQNADRRDVENAGAKAGLAAVKLVQAKTGVVPWMASLVGRTHWVADDAQWLAYETELSKLRMVERGVDYARGLRQTTARARLASVSSAIVNTEAALIPLVSSVGSVSAATNTKAQQDAAALIASKSVWISELALASTEDTGLKAGIEATTQRLKTLEVSIVALATQVASHNKAISDREAEQTRRREQRELLKESWRPRGRIIE